MIWHKDYTIDEVQKTNVNMTQHLGFEITNLGPDSLTGTLPVDHRTKQPIGLFHGGASCVLAETLGSIASNLVLDPTKEYAVGLSITANHLKSARDGKVTGTAKPIHVGKQTHVWDIELFNDAGQKVCVSRLTTAILQRK